MSEKLAKTICRYAQTQGHEHIRLENKGGDLICVCGNGQKTDYLQLNRAHSNSIAETFRYLVGAVENDFFSGKRFKIADGDKIISGRAALLPADEGDKLLITLNSSLPQPRRLGALGLSREQQKLLKTTLNKKSGIIIIAAKEENGATSTYYSLLNAIKNKQSIYSLEAYPAYPLNDINTIDLKRYDGATGALEKILRLDSEIIGIDAILSQEDIKSIWRGARSGRLIIATMQAENSAQALKIIKKAGIGTNDISAHLNLITAQKLFARPCSKCLKASDGDKGIKSAIVQRWPLASSFWPKKIYANRGCRQCRDRQKKGITAIFEVMRFLPDGRLAAGYRPLIIDALEKAGLGLINMEDIASWANPGKKL